MTIFKFLPLVAGAFLLSGCFISKTELISAKDADYPIAAGTHFTAYKLEPDGKRGKEAPAGVTISRKGAFYVYEVKGDAPILGLMDDIGGGLYAAMVRDEDHPGQNLYALFTQAGGIWRSHPLICSDFEKLAATHGKTLAAFHIVKSGSDCEFLVYDDLKTALRFEAQYGAPTAEYVPAT